MVGLQEHVRPAVHHGLMCGQAANLGLDLAPAPASVCLTIHITRAAQAPAQAARPRAALCSPYVPPSMQGLPSFPSATLRTQTDNAAVSCGDGAWADAGVWLLAPQHCG